MRSAFALLLVAALATGCSAAGKKHVHPVTEAGPTIKLFNGKNLDGWYTHTTETGYENPGIFTVVDGMVRVSGGAGDTAYYGGMITKQAYENYRLSFDYKWGGPTWGRRKDKSRDSGVLIHCIGPNSPRTPWMTSYEYQIIEGGTGDILVVNATKQDDLGNPVELEITAEVRKDGKARYFEPGAPYETWKNSGRLNWWGRDPQWKDVTGVRGPKDVESPLGQWTHCEIIALGDEIHFYTNGVLVNRAKGLNVTKGKILFQTEGAEIWYRDIQLTPLKVPAKPAQ